MHFARPFLVIPLVFCGISAAAQTVDCTASDRSCKPIVIRGDSPQRSGFHGYADPSMRRDPARPRIWMSYSWPHISDDAQKTKAVEIHLAHSDDDGDSWVADGPLWTSAAHASQDGTRQYNSEEVSNLYPFQKQDGSVTWVSVRLQYMVDPGASYFRELVFSNRLILNAAATPPQLRDAPQQTLASAGTRPQVNTDASLAALSPDLAGCSVWNEPALAQVGDRLFLAVQCLQLPVRGRNDFYAVFSTDMAGAIAGWKWKYEGRFLGNDDAQQFGYESVVEMDLTKKADGTLLAVLTPNRVASPGKPQDFHGGCRVIRIASLSPPAVARDAQGKIPVLAEIESSDSLPIGPGACTYEPSSHTGIVIPRKTINLQTGLTIGLYATGLRP